MTSAEGASQLRLNLDYSDGTVAQREIKQPDYIPDYNLYNGAGLPASPFRTDDWN